MITQAYYNFFDELAENMNREWFKQNKARFDRDVFEPFKTLTMQVIERMRQINPQIRIDYRQAAFRIYRDTRFSPDKSPYKLWLGAAVNPVGRKNTRFPEIYFQFGKEVNFIAGGLYRPDKETLQKIRHAIAANPEQWQKIKRDPQMLEYFPEGIQGDRNKRLPDRFLMEAARSEPDVLNKNFYTYRTFSPKQIIEQKENLADFIVRRYQAMHLFNRWLYSIVKTTR